MLTKFKVENFKSIHSLELELGRVNVFIGENGSGKSNLLEAVAMASAAINEKLEHEYLVPRGIRMPMPQLIKSAFENQDASDLVKFQIGLPFEQEVGIILEIKDTPFSRLNCSINLNNNTLLKRHAELVKSRIEKDFDTDRISDEMKKANKWLELRTGWTQTDSDEIPLMVRELQKSVSNELRAEIGKFMIFIP